MSETIVIVSSGLVKEVRSDRITSITVRDYDTEGMDEEHLSTDEDGYSYYEYELEVDFKL